MTSPYNYRDGLESERLYTRFLTPDDAETWKQFFEDREAVEFFPDFGLTTTEERAALWIKRQLGRYEEKRFGLQALFTKQTHEFVGQGGLLMQEVDGLRETEVGYHVFKKYWGQGYAPEAARLFIKYLRKITLH
ncbi:GNAT family N-acetyltransferase [Telluribacter sp.]|jgi:RimJ/RimL family protein N-acetyltransferase|uniref:GNAT family N-acetyltransferase n=1 Tax=Telluribacter sp. TaxID=1978767 RepID=UPI002E0E603E|nr:GNAT family N-acetyltransferase [Telluribacter sp.]